ncbi:MAG: hypothetical protein HY698_07790 [Deltaproteobacteria bacterium]|nr:hypothetical protein [Deltaproteobacteria bacterium]
MRRAATHALLILLGAGCALDSGDTSLPPGGTISGTISYTGPAAGGGRPLSIAVYRTYPPSGPPVAWRLVEEYKFPYHYYFENLPPGSYTVGASLDVDPADTRYLGMLNAKRDPHGYASHGKLVSVDAMHGVGGADLKLEDVK